MKKAISIILTVLLSAMLVPVVYAVDAVPKKVLEKTESVVRIEVELTDGAVYVGSGFVIKNDKNSIMVATNNHVIEGDALRIDVYVGQEKIPASVVVATSQKDMAILNLECSAKIPPIKLADKSAAQGDAVYAVGFPAASDLINDSFAYRSEEVTITDGIVSAVRNFTMSDYGTSVKLLQINAAINGGNSGGPLLNEKGEVIGINTLGVDSAQGVFGAIDVSELKSYLEANNIGVKPAINVVVWIAVAVLLVIAVVAVIICRKRRSAKPNQQDVTETILDSDTDKIARETPKCKKKAINVKRTIIFAVMIVFMATAALYTGVIMHAKSESFVKAEKVIILPGIKYADSQLYQYMSAAKLLTEDELDKAKDSFKKMDGYLFAEKFICEVDYRRAQQLADSDDFAGAINIYMTLSKKDYRDSAEKLLETRYRNGMYQFNQGNYIIALDIIGDIREEYEPAENQFTKVQVSSYNQLINQEKYLDAYRVMQLESDNFTAQEKADLQNILYLYGWDYYWQEKYAEARTYFSEISDYKDSLKYIALISVADGGYFTDPEKSVKLLKEIIGFENAAEMLVMNQYMAQEFLKGSWKTSDKSEYLTINSDGSIEHSLPSPKGYENSYYYISEGEYRVYHNNTDNYVVAYDIDVVSADVVKLYCFADAWIYTMYRQ